MSNNEIYKEFGERLKQLRKERGITQAQIAEALGIAQPTIYKYEKGIRKIPMSVLQKFAVYFELSMSELIGVQPTHETVEEPSWLEEIKQYKLHDNEINEVLNFVRYIVTKRN